MKLRHNRVVLHRRYPLLAVLVFLQVFLAWRSWALDPAKSLFQFNCRNWTRGDGLPSDKINSITQTSDGYLWLGTQNGLIRFDGLEFNVVSIDLPSAQGRDIRKLVATRDGKLRFVVNNGGFGNYDGHTFSTLGDERWSRPGLDGNAIMEARDGAVWTGADSGLGRWLPRNPAASGLLDFTNTGAVLSFCESEGERVWIGTSDRGLFYWAKGKLVQCPDEWLKKHNIFALAASTTNQIWIGTDYGLREWINGSVKAVPALQAEVKALLVDRQGIMWAGTSGMGLARCKNGKFEFLTKADGLESDYVTCLFEDAEGSLWVGTRDGLSQLSDLKIPIYSRKEGIVGGSSHSVAASRNGGLWIGADEGLSYFDGSDARNYDMQALVSSRYVKLCFEARNGDVYSEDSERDINVMSGGRVIGHLTNSTWVSAFAEDAEGVLVARGTGDALFRIHDGQFVRYQYKDGSQPNYYWVNNLFVAKDGAVWVASKNGIYRIQAGVVKRWSADSGLSGDIGTWICQDTDGSVWAGLASGIARFKNGEVRNITPGDGLADNCIYAIVPDDYGYFWFSSSRGIFRVSRENLNDFADKKAGRVECELFDGQEAIKSIGRTDQEYSGCKTSDGRIWFPSPWGVLMIDPARLPRNEVAPPVHIDHVAVNGRQFPPGQPIVVPPGRTQLEFQMAALSFVAPEKIRFRYQLEGFDDDWIAAEGRRQAFYTGLKPGHYVFHVIAANADGVWNRTGDSVPVELRPYFHQTAAFYFLCVTAGVALVAGVYWLRVRQLKSRQLALQLASDRLEVEVKNRTAELATTNASLQREVKEHRQTELQLKKRTELLENEIAERERMQKQLLDFSREAGMAEVATNVLHNVGNVLNSVNVSAEVVADKTKNSKVASLDKVTDMLSQHANDMAAFLASDPKGRRLPEYLKELTELLKTERQAAIKELELLRKNVHHIKEIVARQQNYAKARGITEIVKVSELVDDALRMSLGGLARPGFEIVREFANIPPVVLDKHKVLQILVNLIRNAKYACDDSGRPDKQLKMTISQIGEFVQIAAIDNGVGIPPENMTHIFSHGFTTRKGGHGFGLHSGALAARDLGGSLTAHSDGSGRGATFTLKIPLEAPKNGVPLQNGDRATGQQSALQTTSAAPAAPSAD